MFKFLYETYFALVYDNQLCPRLFSWYSLNWRINVDNLNKNSTVYFFYLRKEGETKIFFSLRTNPHI